MKRVSHFFEFFRKWMTQGKGRIKRLCNFIEGKHQPKQKQTQAKICKKEMVIYNEEGKTLKT